MNKSINNFFSITALLICFYLVLKNSYSATSIINSLGSLYTNSVKAITGKKITITCAKGKRSTIHIGAGGRSSSGGSRKF